MKKIILLLSVTLISLSIHGQSIPIEITAGMTGLQLRNAININFDSLDARWHDIWRLDSAYRAGGVGGLSVKDYGAVGDGVTDDADAIEAALLDANGRKLIFPAGNYLINQGISVTIDTTVIIEGHGAKLIAGTMTGGASVLKITSTLVPGGSIRKNIEELDRYFLKTGSYGLVSGDILKVQSDSVYMDYINSNSGYSWTGNSGELVEVWYETTDSVLVNTRFLRPFRVYQDASFSIVNKNPVTITGLQIEGSQSTLMWGIMVENRANVDISNCIISKCYYGCISLTDVMNGHLENNHVSDSYYTGLGYGIVLTDSRAITISHNIAKNCRHGIVTGGFDGCEEIMIHDNLCFSDPRHAYQMGNIDTHPMDIYITIKDNTVQGDGFSISSGPTTDITNNTIYLDAKGQYNIGIEVIYGNHHSSRNTINVSNNTIIPMAPTGSYQWTPVGIYITNMVNIYERDSLKNTLDLLTINNNVLTNCQIPIYICTNNLVNADTGIINKTVIHGNVAYGSFLGNVIGGYKTFMYDVEFKNNTVDTCDMFNGGWEYADDGYHGWIGKLTYTNNVSKMPVFKRIRELYAANNTIYTTGNEYNYSSIDTVTTAVFTNNLIKDCVNGGAYNYAFGFNEVTTLINHSNLYLNNTRPVYKSNITNDYSGLNYWDGVPLIETAIATSDGLTTGLLPYSSAPIIISSDNANYICCLPSTSATTIGLNIVGQVGANGFELRPIAAQAGTVYINNVTTNVEAAIPANSTFEIKCIDATHWILKCWDAYGDIIVIVPDAI